MYNTNLLYGVKLPITPVSYYPTKGYHRPAQVGRGPPVLGPTGSPLTPKLFQSAIRPSWAGLTACRFYCTNSPKNVYNGRPIWYNCLTVEEGHGLLIGASGDRPFEDLPKSG
jgi:hypothetical protein